MKNKNYISLLEIEHKIMFGNLGKLTLNDFSEQLWFYLSYYKLNVRKYARELNVYPSLGNVHAAMLEYFT